MGSSRRSLLSRYAILPHGFVFRAVRAVASANSSRAEIRAMHRGAKLLHCLNRPSLNFCASARLPARIRARGGCFTRSESTWGQDHPNVRRPRGAVRRGDPELAFARENGRRGELLGTPRYASSTALGHANAPAPAVKLLLLPQRCGWCHFTSRLRRPGAVRVGLPGPTRQDTSGSSRARSRKSGHRAGF